MSGTNNFVKYTLGVSVGEPNNSQWEFLPTLTVTTDQGATDEVMMGIAQAFHNAPWPNGWVTTVSLDRHDVEDTDYAGDLTTGTFV